MSRAKREQSGEGQFAFEGLDRALHEKARLGILSSLLANPQGLLFTELKTLCNLTDGNLSRHLQVLQEAGLVEVWKRTRGKRTQTLVRMTEDGHARFLDYLGVLEQIVTNAIQASQATRATQPAGRHGWGWSAT